MHFVQLGQLAFFALISQIILIVCHQCLNIQISKYKIQILTCCPHFHRGWHDDDGGGDNDDAVGDDDDGGGDGDGDGNDVGGGDDDNDDAVGGLGERLPLPLPPHRVGRGSPTQSLTNREQTRNTNI